MRPVFQLVPRCFFCDAWLTSDDAFLTRHGRVFGECCADVAAVSNETVTR